MSFTCPVCKNNTLKITKSIELPPDSRSDEISLQLIHCGGCKFSGLAVYEESRRGVLGEDSFSHTGYRVSTDTLTALRTLIHSCPVPGNKNCNCKAHRVLGSRDQGMQWNGLAAFDLGDQFHIG